MAVAILREDSNMVDPHQGKDDYSAGKGHSPNNLTRRARRASTRSGVSVEYAVPKDKDLTMENQF
jgi:hypothetical protein